MKTKLIFTCKTGKEILVATFANTNEAAQCRDLLQAKCADQDHCYYAIEFKDMNGTLRRQGPDPFHKQVQYLHPGVQGNIKILLS